MTMPPTRSGVALLLVIALMGVAAALVIAATDTVESESRTAMGEADRHLATVAAETEIWTTLHGLDARAVRTFPIGTRSANTRTTAALTLITSVDRVDTSTVWIVATATLRNRANFARHGIGMTVLIPHDPADSVLRPAPDRAWVELF